VTSSPTFERRTFFDVRSATSLSLRLDRIFGSLSISNRSQIQRFAIDGVEAISEEKKFDLRKKGKQLSQNYQPNNIGILLR
jgi:hypothetical protein